MFCNVLPDAYEKDSVWCAVKEVSTQEIYSDRHLVHTFHMTFSVLNHKMQYSGWLYHHHLLSLRYKNHAPYKVRCENTMKIPLKKSAPLCFDLNLSPFLDFSTNACFAFSSVLSCIAPSCLFAVPNYFTLSQHLL